VLLVALRLMKTLGFVSGNTILVARMVKPWQLLVRDVFFRPVMRILFLQYLPRCRVKKAVTDSSSTRRNKYLQSRCYSWPPMLILLCFQTGYGIHSQKQLSKLEIEKHRADFILHEKGPHLQPFVGLDIFRGYSRN